MPDMGSAAVTVGTPQAGPSDGMVGRIYLERGKPVTVLERWGKGGGPRNVLIERGDGSKVVRPFRGLRRAVYTVSAVRPVTALHIEDPKAVGRTKCDQPMPEAGLWLRVERQPGEAVCRGCLGITDEQGTLL